MAVSIVKKILALLALSHRPIFIWCVLLPIDIFDARDVERLLSILRAGYQILNLLILI